MLKNRGRLVAIATVALTLALIPAAFAGQAMADEATDISFFSNSSGIYPDTYTNTELLNLGHRGCNSCHEDLADVMGDPTRPELHAVVSAGYGKALTLDDCGSCHGFATGFYAPNLGDIVHGKHYSSETFVNDYNGNCWSCHAVEHQEDGSWDLCMFEDIMYEPTLGGYYDAVSNWKCREWVRDHGHGSDFLTGFATEAEENWTVEFDQHTTDLADKFVVYNYPPDMLDMDSVAAADNTLTLKGVNEERSFTVDDLKAMNVVTKTYAHACVTNGQGGDLIGNWDYTGVMLTDLIDACGGLVEGNNMAGIECYDGWKFAHNLLPMEGVYENAMIAFEINGEPLNMADGGPMLLALPGMPGGAWGKYIKEITFEHADEPYNILQKVTHSDKYYGLANFVNSCFYEASAEVNLGETVELHGSTWGWYATDCEVTTLSFSLDGGVTWYDQAIPEDFDPMQLDQFTFTWTPTEPGLYVLKINATNAEGKTQPTPTSIFIQVNA